MYLKETLPNHLRLLLVPLKNTKTVTVLVVVKVGSKYETKKINGISHFLEHLFFKGTEKRPTKLEIGKEFDQIGGEYNAFTSQEYTGFYAKVNSRHLEIALDIISDILIHSKFDEAELKREKGVILEEINMYQDTPTDYIHTLWHKLLYGDQPAGWDILGSKETIASLGRKDILDYYKKYYTPSNIVVCLGGNLPLESEILSQNDKKSKYPQIENYFSYPSQVQPINEKKQVKISQKCPEILMHYKKTDQTHLMIGVRGYNLFHKDKFAINLLSVILGSGMSSRLFMEIRENRGLSYYIYTSNEADTDTGYLVTGAGLDNKKIDEAIKVILGEYKKIRDEGVTEEELKKAKEYIKGKMALNLETSDEWANFYAGQELLQKKVMSLEEIFAQIDKVSLADIKRIAEDIFVNNKLNLALIGPIKKLKTEIKF